MMTARDRKEKPAVIFKPSIAAIGLLAGCATGTVEPLCVPTFSAEMVEVARERAGSLVGNPAFGTMQSASSLDFRGKQENREFRVFYFDFTSKSGAAQTAVVTVYLSACDVEVSIRDRLEAIPSLI
jgi:hypothetical protein